MAVTLNLTPLAEQALRDRAGRVGLSLEAYVEWVLTRDVVAATGGPHQPVTDVKAWAAELSAGMEGVPVLEGKLDREQLYEDHD